MTEITKEQFVALWNAADTLARVVDSVSDHTGVRIPRWAVLSRAISYRADGRNLKPFVDEVPARSAVARARELAAQLMSAHGLEKWEFRFNTNVRRAGVCRYPIRGNAGRIELSRFFVEQNIESEVVDTLLHEIAHALVGPGHGHDAVWKSKCVQIGARPERCYRDQIAMPRGRWRAHCPACSREYDRHRRPDRLTGWYCKPCGKDRGSLQWRESS